MSFAGFSSPGVAEKRLSTFSEAAESKERGCSEQSGGEDRSSCACEHEHFLGLSDVSHFAFHVTGRVKASESVLALLSLLESNVLGLVAGLEAAHEDHRDLTLALTFATDRALFFSDNPVTKLIEFKIFAEDAWLARADNVHGEELVGLGLLVNLCLYLEAIIETSLKVLGEHEAES